MTPLSPAEAERLLAGQPLRIAVEAGALEVSRVRARCLAAGVAAVIGPCPGKS